MINIDDYDFDVYKNTGIISEDNVIVVDEWWEYFIVASRLFDDDFEVRYFGYGHSEEEAHEDVMKKIREYDHLFKDLG